MAKTSTVLGAGDCGGGSADAFSMVSNVCCAFASFFAALSGETSDGNAAVTSLPLDELWDAEGFFDEAWDAEGFEGFLGGPGLDASPTLTPA
jgi:hypothetical protein